MSRKVTVKIEIEATMIIDEGVEVGHVINELDCSLLDTTTQATIEDIEIAGYEVTDSR